MFNGPFVVKPIFAQPKFATAPLLFAYIMHIEKKQIAGKVSA